MLKRKLSVFIRIQVGFTLIEIVVAIALTSLIGTAVATATYQLIKVNAKSTNHQLAVSQVQNAVNSISRDAQQAQNIIPRYANNALIPISSNQIAFNLINDSTTGTPDKLELKWVAWDNTVNDVIYTISSGTLKKNSLIVATNVTAASGNWDVYARTLTLTIVASVPNTTATNKVTEQRTLQIIPRPAQ